MCLLPHLKISLEVGNIRASLDLRNSVTQNGHYGQADTSVAKVWDLLVLPEMYLTSLSLNLCKIGTVIHLPEA